MATERSATDSQPTPSGLGAILRKAIGEISPHGLGEDPDQDPARVKVRTLRNIAAAAFFVLEAADIRAGAIERETREETHDVLSRYEADAKTLFHSQLPVYDEEINTTMTGWAAMHYMQLLENGVEGVQPGINPDTLGAAGRLLDFVESGENDNLKLQIYRIAVSQLKLFLDDEITDMGNSLVQGSKLHQSAAAAKEALTEHTPITEEHIKGLFGLLDKSGHMAATLVGGGAFGEQAIRSVIDLLHATPAKVSKQLREDVAKYIGTDSLEYTQDQLGGVVDTLVAEHGSELRISSTIKSAELARAIATRFALRHAAEIFATDEAGKPLSIDRQHARLRDIAGMTAEFDAQEVDGSLSLLRAAKLIGN